MSKMLIAQMLKKIFKYHLMNKMKLFYSKYTFYEDFGRLVRKQNKVEVYLRRPHKFDITLFFDVNTAGILVCVPHVFLFLIQKGQFLECGL